MTDRALLETGNIDYRVAFEECKIAGLTVYASREDRI